MPITGGFGMKLDLSRGGMRRWVMGRDGIQRWMDTSAVVGCDDCLGEGKYQTCEGDQLPCPCVTYNAALSGKPAATEP